MEVCAAIESVHMRDATRLIERLSLELAARYEEPAGSDAGNFQPSDMDVSGAAFVIARAAGLAVACGAVRPFNEPGFDRAGEIKRVYVAPEWRGQGLAKRVLCMLEAYARGYGYRQLVLETGLRQPESINLYERLGYARIPRYGRYASDALSICMAKPLPLPAPYP